MRKMKEWTIRQINILENRDSPQSKIPQPFTDRGAGAARAFHEQLKEYRKTPLLSLPHLAEKWNIGGIYVKDESERFSLNAFKGLGGSYAMFRIICERLGLDPTRTSLKELAEGANREKISRLTFVTCTDGNHGRGVGFDGCRCGCIGGMLAPEFAENCPAGRPHRR